MGDTLVSAVRRGGLRVAGIDLEAFALIRSLVPHSAGERDGAHVLCHIGAGATNIVVSVDRMSQFTRLVGLGGVDLTNAVADQTGLAAHEVEALKAACGLLGDVPAGWDQATVTRVRHALALAVRPLVQEIGRTIDFHRPQEFARPVDRLVLPGGTRPRPGGIQMADAGVDLGDHACRARAHRRQVPRQAPRLADPPVQAPRARAVSVPSGGALPNTDEGLGLMPHGIHGVMRFVAVKRPVAWSVGDELERLHLADRNVGGCL